MINEEHTVLISSLCYICTRWSVALVIALLILVDTLGGPSAYTKWLSSELFVHIGKIEYAFYILNPMVIVVLSAFSSAGVFMDGIMAVCLVDVWVTLILLILYVTLYFLQLMMLISASVLTYGAAVILTVLVERPCSLLTNKSLKL
jgi:peptidoglycan/LPS O-acetylase OafA/YrhL